ncbi:SH3 domain-containing protein [Streptomyces sp. 142MFCol3.1]|uniref:SH3 domain-containing protein n=1 Tax=Streptomyces sp. 142MFCol3.1 TaxID=1172179 RepID=UPI0004278F7F|nr:SH3 domain-containing protein [Streptomyces sp. 142MFCol3.1]
MLRRTTQSGLLATVAVFALLPTAAVAADSGTTVSRPAHSAAPHGTYSPLPALGSSLHTTTRHTPKYRHHTKRHVTHHRTHAVGRVVTRRAALNVRSGPGTGYSVVGHRSRNGLVHLTCLRDGSSVFGVRHWYRLAHHKGYVSARYVYTRGFVPWC